MAIRLKLRHPTRPAPGQIIINTDGVYECLGRGWYNKLEDFTNTGDEMKSVLPTPLQLFETGLKSALGKGWATKDGLDDSEFHKAVYYRLGPSGSLFGVTWEFDEHGTLFLWVGAKDGRPDTKGKLALDACRRITKVPYPKPKKTTGAAYAAPSTRRQYEPKQ